MERDLCREAFSIIELVLVKYKCIIKFEGLPDG